MAALIVNMSYTVAQMGARMHYAVPRMLGEAGLLERFFTDFCASKGWPRLLQLVPPSFRPESVRRLLGRVPAGVSSNRIVGFNGLGCEYALRRRKGKAPTVQTAAHLWAGREFCRRVVESGLGACTGVYCFNSAGLEILQRARQEGLKRVLEQTIAPKRVELGLLETERKRFPNWEPPVAQDALADEFSQREVAEWQASDLVLCGSEFVREGIRQCGGPVEKCLVVPYGVDLPLLQPKIGNGKSELRNRPLRVLTVGAIGLRKGSPYVMEAAKRLRGKATFRMVGSIGIMPEAERQLRGHVELTGAVPSSEVARHFEWADVFLLPSICEGSATVTYEAMAYGLPVICTPNTGSVIRNGVDGFLVPVNDSGAIVARLHTLADDCEERTNMGCSAQQRARGFTLEHYGRRLLAALASSKDGISPGSHSAPDQLHFRHS